MKILSVKGKNLASIAQEFTIDFTDPRFVRSGLFAITGNTGAGKSTILDAISLALYATTPRFANSKSTKVELNNIDININNPCNILTYGAKKGYAEVKFIGNNGYHYISRWEVERTRSKLQESMRLEVEETNVCLTKKREILQTVIEAIGLDAVQFNQVVLLPQGDFSNFLKAEPDKRLALLEKITGSTIYKSLSKMAFEKNKQIEEQIKEERLLVSALEVLDDKEFQELRQEHAQAQSMAERIKLRLEHIDDYQETLSEYEIIRAKVTKLKQDLINKEASNSALEIANKRKKYQEYIEYAGNIHFISELKSLQKECHELAIKKQSIEKELSELAQEIHKLEPKLDEQKLNEFNFRQKCLAREEEVICAKNFDIKITSAQQLLADLAQDLSKKQAQKCAKKKEVEEKNLAKENLLEQNQDLLAQIAGNKTATYVFSLNDIEDNLRNFIKLQSEIGNYQEQEELIKEKLGKITLRIESLKLEQGKVATNIELLNEKMNLVKEQNKKLAASSLDELNILNEQFRKMQLLATQVALMPKKIGSKIANDEQIISLKNKEQTLLDQISKDEQKVTQLESQVLKLTQEYKNKEKLSIFKEQRKHLIDNEPCPLCGSVHHPYADIEFDDKEFELLKFECDNVTDSLKAIKESLADKKIAYSSEHANLMHLTNSQKDLEAEISGYLQKITELCQSVNKTTVYASTVPFWDKFNDELSASIKEQEQNIKKIKDDLQQKDTNQHQLNELSNELLKLQESYNLFTNEINTLELDKQDFDIKSISAEISSRKESVNNYRSSIDRYLKDVLPWESYVIKEDDNKIELIDSGSEKLLKVLLANITSYNKQVEEQQKIEEQISKLAVEIAKANSELALFTSESDNKAKDVQSKEQELKDLTDKRKFLLDGRSVEQYEKDIQDTKDEFSKSIGELENKINLTKSKYSHVSINLTDAQTSFMEHSAEFDKVEREFERTAQSYGVEISYFRNILELDKKELSSYQVAFDRYDEEVAQLKNDISSNEQIALRLESKVREQKSCLNQEDLAENGTIKAQSVSALTTNLAKKQEEVDNLSHRIKSDLENRAKRENAEQKIKKIMEDNLCWSKLNELIGSSTGENFSRFAQSITFDMLLNVANRYLRDFMPRYELKRVVDRNFKAYNLLVMVIDHENGDMERPYATISGGETFAVSLSLAIALSDITCGGKRIESLFIDEGFATLDPDNLECVMGVLEKLNRKGRTIGIISHLESIPTRVDTRVALERILDEPMHSKVVIYPKL